MAVASFAGAACTGQPDLFESMDWDDHRKARAICRTCPLVEQCRHEAEVIGKEWARGTWGGELLGKRGGKPAWLLQQAG